MASKKFRATFVALTELVGPQLSEPDHAGVAIRAGRVLVNGAVVLNPRARVRADASIRIRGNAPLRGKRKLEAAIEAFELEITGRVALDVGAAAGGFTAALLAAGARRVFAVDVGVGQLRGWLRQDPRVVNLERINLSELTPGLVDEPADLVTLDLSYLSVAEAAGQLDPEQLCGPHAKLVALVKPTYELGTPSLAAAPAQVARASERASRGLEAAGWEVVSLTKSPIRGSGGAVEVFLLARRRVRPTSITWPSRNPLPGWR